MTPWVFRAYVGAAEGGPIGRIIHGGHYGVSGAPLSFSTGWELGGFYSGTLRGIAQRLAGDDARRVRVVSSQPAPRRSRVAPAPSIPVGRRLRQPRSAGRPLRDGLKGISGTPLD